MLSNIDLHDVLDLWFESRFARGCAGKAYPIRYADDDVACFEHEADANAFLAAMTERLAAFDLEVEPSKTALLRFDSHALGQRADTAAGPRTFSFLGFIYYVGRRRRGRFMVGRKTDGKRMAKKLKLLNERLRGLRTQGGAAMLAYLVRHLRGHIQYYGVSGNARSVAGYLYFAGGLLFKWLNRRSQRRSLTWKRFGAAVRPLLPRARIVHDTWRERGIGLPDPSRPETTGSRNSR